MKLQNRFDLKSIILELLEKNVSVTLQEIAHQANLSAASSAARRAIQRALTELIQDGKIEAKGIARARVYLKSRSIENNAPFKNIVLSEPSQKLLRAILQPIHAKKPAGYNADFLRNYHPNKTAYIDLELQKELFRIGNSEPIARPSGTYARTILNRLLIDLSWNSSRLEGNTYSLLETKRLIELGEVALGKDMMETQMILNHKNAIEYIMSSVNEKKITAHEVRSIHALLSENLLGDPSASGNLRKIAVAVSGTAYLPLDNPHLIKENFDIFIEKINLIDNPFEQSFFSLVHLSYLQAFEDVNKRTARLVANIPFIKQNLKPLSFIDVNQNDYVTALLGVYEKNDTCLLRDFYSWAYQRSAERYSAIQQSMGQPNLFKFKYQRIIQEIVRHIVLNNITGKNMVPTIKNLVAEKNLSIADASHLFEVIETEIMSLHEGNIAIFKIKPDEYEKWKSGH